MKKKKIVYGIIIAVVLLALASLDYMIVKENPDVMDHSLAMLGEKLVEMAPEGKDAVRGLFDQFVNQVQAKEVSPEQVEMMAANILNLSNQEAQLSPEQVESFFTMTLSEVEPRAVIMADTAGGDVRVVSQPITRAKLKPDPPIDQKRMLDLGHRLKVLIDLNESLKPKVPAGTHYRFQVSDGIVMSVDPEIEGTMDKQEFQELTREFTRLQGQRMVSWRENLSKQSVEKMKQHQNELIAIRKLREQENEAEQKEAKISVEVQALEHLKHLEALGYTAAFQTDSIHIIIEERLKEAKKAMAKARSRAKSESR